MGCHALLQGIFSAQGSNPGLPHCWRVLYRLSYQGSPWSGYLSLLQVIFLTQESNQGLLHCRQILYQLSYQGSPLAGCISLQISPCLNFTKVKVLVTQLCQTLCNPMDRSPPGSSVHGIFQSRTLKEFPFPCPEDIPDPGIEPWFPTLHVDSLPSDPPGKPSVKQKQL